MNMIYACFMNTFWSKCFILSKSVEIFNIDAKNRDNCY